MRAELFLQKYRVLEGLLEKRYSGRKMSSPSVVIEYIRDEDSEGIRVELDLLREIRNILSHNAGSSGNPVVEPSQEMIDRLDQIIEYVQKPRAAVEFGTPASSIMAAHPNDFVWDIMRSMRKNGYSHVPVTSRKGFLGVFSIKCIFDYLAENGLDSLAPEARIEWLGDQIQMGNHQSERYLFLSEDTSIVGVRNAFEQKQERNRRLTAVFITKNGTPDEPILCMLTPWDVLDDQIPD